MMTMLLVMFSIFASLFILNKLISIFNNKILNNIKVYKIQNIDNRKLNNDYNILLNKKQYRVSWEFGQWCIYNFSDGTDYYGFYANYIFKAIYLFHELERVKDRREVFEKEMFKQLESSFSEWDEKMSSRLNNSDTI